MAIYVHPNGVETEIKNIYIWEYVEPRTPWVNTVAYYKLESDVNDTMGTYNLTNSWITFGSLWGVVCANFNGSSSYASWNFYSFGTNELTCSAWGYPNSNIQGVWYCLGNSTLVLSSINWFVDWTSAPTPANQWTNIVFTIGWGKLKIYSNWVLYLDTNFSNNVNWTLRLWRNQNAVAPLNWGLSEIIFEKVAWTAQEVTDYYNLTKWDYWL